MDHSKQTTNTHDRNAFSIRELAERNSVSVGTIYKEIRRGNLRPIKVGSRTLVPATEEVAWLQRLQDPAA